MKALLGRICCAGGTFHEEFITQASPSSPFTWTRDKALAKDFVTICAAEQVALRNTYQDARGRLRIPCIISDVAPVAPKFTRRAWRERERKVSPAECFEQNERRHLA